MATRPSTPYYFYSDPDAASTASSSSVNGDPPPSYTSSESDPSSSLSSPRSSSSSNAGGGDPSLMHSLSESLPSSVSISRRNGAGTAAISTVIDMGPLAGSESTTHHRNTSSSSVNQLHHRSPNARITPLTSTLPSSSSSSSSRHNGSNSLSASLTMTDAGGHHSNTGSSIASSVCSADERDLYPDESSEYSVADSATGRCLRFGGSASAHLEDGASAAGFGSVLSSRAASPALINSGLLQQHSGGNGAPSSSIGTSASGTTSPSALSSVSSSSSSAVHHHIHHHYHHGDATASTSAGSALVNPSSSITSNASSSISSTSSSSGSGSGGNAKASQKGSTKDRRKVLSNSADYDVPDDGYFFAGNGYHYRSGPLARKLGSTILSRDPSLTDLPLLGSSSGAATPNSAFISTASRRRAGWKSPRRPNNAVDGFLSSCGDDLSPLPGSASFSSGNGFNNPLLLDGSTSAGIGYRNRRRFSAFVPISIQKWYYRFLRHPLVPTQPMTILFSLALFALFAFSVTTFMFHILSTDKAPRPWRQYCQEQRPFPHALADSLAPVDVFVGVFSVDAAYERRHLIRSTYLRHSRPIDPHTGRPATNVQVKFILGRPRRHHARRIALEMETYNDIVVLDMKENMNQGKTHAFFKWANENATVPIYYKPPHAAKRIGKLTPITSEDGGQSNGQQQQQLTLGFKKADYVVKADDDSFLVLSELERHLRVAPRSNMYWGYLIRNLFMGGECYALSADLVNYVATYPALEAYTTGAEDKRVAKWMRLHPNATSINWITERCYIYDHPKAATTYSHGFLFPDEVERVRGEGRTGISAAERQRRGGEFADAWSSVSKWKKSYVKPKKDLTIEEEVEALVEGGGRWTALDGWTNKISSKDVIQWDSVVFENTDERIRGGAEKHTKADEARSQYNARTETAFGKYNRIPNSLLRDPGDLDIRPQHAKRSWEFWKRDGQDETHPSPGSASLSPLSSYSNVSQSSSSTDNASSELSSSSSVSSAPSSSSAPAKTSHDPYERIQPDEGAQYPIGSSPGFKKGFSFLPDAPANPDVHKTRAVPAPTLRYDPSTMTLRERRFLGLPYGGTVVVHYLKRNEWFLETALALLGREKFWDTGIDPPAYQPYIPPRPAGDTTPPKYDHHDDAQKQKQNTISTIPTWNGKGEIDIVPAEWGSARMYGSPLVKENGYVAMGRTVPWDALQKSEQGKYGKLRGSPRQRYADMPEEQDGQDGDVKDEEGKTGLTSRSVKESSTASSSSDTIALSSSETEQHSHSALSSLQSQSQDRVDEDASTSSHDHTMPVESHGQHMDQVQPHSSVRGLGLQDPNAAALVFS